MSLKTEDIYAINPLTGMIAYKVKELNGLDWVAIVPLRPEAKMDTPVPTRSTPYIKLSAEGEGFWLKLRGEIKLGDLFRFFADEALDEMLRRSS